VRQYWLGQIKEFIHAGADGVEFRWASHQNSMELDAYGFNEPVVAEFRKRYGVDIRTEDFDRAKWRQLLGQYYTQFLRQARDLLHRHGRKMMVDVMPSNDSNPAHPQFLNIFLDWEQWFSFADGVSCKWVPLESCQRFRTVAEKYHIPTFHNVWPEVVFKGMDSRQIARSIEQMKAAGHKGFMLYEAAAFMKAKSNGRFDLTFPQIPDAIVPAVKKINSPS
jgi:hypothetical protein